MVLRISSSWWSVDVPGNRGLPRSISPRMQPRLHMSTPGVYLGQERVEASGAPQAEVGQRGTFKGVESRALGKGG